MRIQSIPQQVVQQFQQTRSNQRLKKQVDTFLGSLRTSDSTKIQLNRLNELSVRLCIDRKTQKQYVEISHPDAKKALAVGYQKARSYRLCCTRPTDMWKLNNFRPLLKQENSNKETLRLTNKEKHALLMQLNQEAHRRAESHSAVPLFNYLKGEQVDIPDAYRFNPDHMKNRSHSAPASLPIPTSSPIPASPPITGSPLHTQEPTDDTRKEPIFVQTVFVEGDSDNDSVLGPLEEAGYQSNAASSNDKSLQTMAAQPTTQEPTIDTRKKSIFIQTVFVEGDSDNDSVLGPLEEAPITSTKTILEPQEDNDLFYDVLASLDEAEEAPEEDIFYDAYASLDEMKDINKIV